MKKTLNRRDPNQKLERECERHIRGIGAIRTSGFLGDLQSNELQKASADRKRNRGAGIARAIGRQRNRRCAGEIHEIGADVHGGMLQLNIDVGGIAVVGVRGADDGQKIHQIKRGKRRGGFQINRIGIGGGSGQRQRNGRLLRRVKLFARIVLRGIGVRICHKFVRLKLSQFFDTGYFRALIRAIVGRDGLQRGLRSLFRAGQRAAREMSRLHALADRTFRDDRLPAFDANINRAIRIFLQHRKGLGFSVGRVIKSSSEFGHKD